MALFVALVCDAQQHARGMGRGGKGGDWARVVGGEVVMGGEVSVDMPRGDIAGWLLRDVGRAVSGAVYLLERQMLC